MLDTEPLMTVRDVAAYLARSERAVAHLARRGMLRTTRIGARLRFRRADVDVYMSRRGNNMLGTPATARTRPEPDRDSQQLQELAILLSEARPAAETASIIVAQGIAALGAAAGWLYQITPDETELVALAAQGAWPPRHEASDRVAIDARLPLTEAARSGKQLVFQSPADLEAYSPQLASAMLGNGYQASFVQPLLLKGHAIGALSFRFAQPRTFSEGERVFMRAFARLSAQAIDRAQLYDAEHQARAAAEVAQQRLAVLAHISGVLSASLDYPTTLQRLAEQLVPDQADYCVIYVRDANNQLRRQGRAHVDAEKIALLDEIEQLNPIDADGPTQVARVIQAGRAQLIDSYQQPSWALRPTARYRAIWQALGPRQGIVVPLQARGYTIGALMLVMSESPRQLHESDLSFAEQIADRAAMVIDNARLYQQSQQHIIRNQLLAESMRVFAEAQRSPADILDSISAQIAAVLGDSCTLRLLAPDQQRLSAIGAYHSGHVARALLRELAQAELAQGSPGALFQHAAVFQPQIGPEQAGKLLPAIYQPYIEQIGIASLLAVQVRLQDGTLGSICATRDRAGAAYTREDQQFLQDLADRAAIIIDNARLYAAEQSARATAEAAVHMRDSFFSVAAHELKTPLTALLGQAQLIQRRDAREDNLNARDRRSLAVIVDQAKRLNKLMSALLDFSRLQQGRLVSERVPIDLVGLVRQVIDEITVTLEQHTIALDAPPAPQLISGDALRLEQVLQNVIGNAVKYSPHGGAIEVRLERSGQSIRVLVRDHGIGIPASDVPQLFQRFYRASNVDERQISGMGIGLFVVREIMAEHGGTIALESAEGQGSLFTLSFPLVEQVQAPG